MTEVIADFFVSTKGRDYWSGKLPVPSMDGRDGPFATVARAQKAVRELLATAGDSRAPVTVLIRGGDYSLGRPLVFRPEDSGTAAAPVTYAAYPGEHPVLSGGRAISGWKKGKDGVWTAEVPGVREGKWYFHQLFVNGKRATRARHPNTGYLKTAGRPPGNEEPHGLRGNKAACGLMSFNEGDLKRFGNLDDVNVFLYHSWTSSLHWIQGLDLKKRVAYFTAAAHWPTGYWEAEQRYYLENAREFLDEPGEWYLDRATGLLHYLPLPGGNFATAEVVAPALQELVVFRGNPAKQEYVQHIALRGLSFQHADWHIPNKGEADGQAAVFLGGAIFGRGMLNCTIEQCELAHCGKYGVWLERGCRDNTIRQCEIHDLGAGGIKVGETCSVDKAELATAHNVIDNCYIHDGGHVFPAGVGVLILRSSSNTVSHCEICDFYYTGVSVGWSWGYAPSSASHNVIEYNHIHDLGKGQLSDMGGIYTLGISPGTVLRYNLIHDLEAVMYGGWGIYPDEGSTHILIENNICYNCKTGGFHQHYGRENLIQNNIFALSPQMQVSRTRQEDHRSFTFERNIVYCTNPQVLGGQWSNNNYSMERNLYWNASGPELLFDGMNFERWQAEGRDVQSAVADPLFVDVEAHDFRLQKGSPALRLGFTPIKTDGIGLYGEKRWVKKPLER